MSKENGGPAFPCEVMTGQVVHENGRLDFLKELSGGMSLRDYFAAKALQGLLADTNIQSSAEEFASRAYDVADAMLEARK